MRTSYDTRNNLALSYLSAMFGVEFGIADDIRRDPCPQCSETGAINACRVNGDSASTSPDVFECCISCLDKTIKVAVGELRTEQARVTVEVAARLTAYEGDVVIPHAGVRCMRTRRVLPEERHVIVDSIRLNGPSYLLVCKENSTGEPARIRMSDVALICSGVRGA